MNKILLSTVIICTGIVAHSQYCLTGGPSTANDSNLESLSLTGTSGGINYVGCPGVIGVEEFLGQTTTMNAGAAYVVTAEFGTCGGNYPGVAEIWIDFNQNGLFEPSESIATWQGTPPMVAPGNYIFNVPAGSMNGLTRMRVVHAEGQALPLDPCVAFTWGSATDFMVEIQNGVDCSGYIGDDSSNPRSVPTIPYIENHDNSYCYSNQNPAYNSPDVYYLIVPGSLTSINASLCGSSFDTYISVQDKYGTVIAQNDDYAPCGTQSEVNFSTVGYDSVYVIVEGWGTQMGSYTLTIGEGIVGLDDLTNDPFKIYPNPAKGSFKLEGNYSGELQILNTEGKIVLTENVNQKDEINTSSLSSGFYIVRLNDNGRSYDKKLIIE